MAGEDRPGGEYGQHQRKSSGSLHSLTCLRRGQEHEIGSPDMDTALRKNASETSTYDSHPPSRREH